jgi:predicted permease
MITILDAVVPLFSLIIIGYVAGLVRWIDARGVKALVAFVFNIAMPPLLFRLVVQSDITGAIDPWFMLCHVTAQFAVALLGALIGRLLLRLDGPATVIQGFGSSFPNSVLLGIPLMLALFGERGAIPVTMIFAFNVALYSLVTMLLETARSGQAAGGGDRIRPGAILLTTVHALIRNPIIMAALAGMAASTLGLTLPPVVDRTLAFIGQAGPATALFALGASLSVREIARGLHGPLGAAGLMTTAKLLLHPLLAWLLAVPILGLDPFMAKAAIIVAALPVGANVYIFAQHYDVGVAQASSAILISTGISMASIPLVLWLVV